MGRQALLHAFDGKSSYADSAAKQGFLFSIPPCIARSPKFQKLVEKLPLSSLLLETDSPVLGPEKDTRNEPSNASVSCEWIARVKGIAKEEVVKATTQNAQRLFIMKKEDSQADLL